MTSYRATAELAADEHIEPTPWLMHVHRAYQRFQCHHRGYPSVIRLGQKQKLDIFRQLHETGFRTAYTMQGPYLGDHIFGVPVQWLDTVWDRWEIVR